MKKILAGPMGIFPKVRNTIRKKSQQIHIEWYVDIHRYGISLHISRSKQVRSWVEYKKRNSISTSNIRDIYHVEHIYAIYQSQHFPYIMFIYFGMLHKSEGKGLHACPIWKELNLKKCFFHPITSKSITSRLDSRSDK